MNVNISLFQQFATLKLSIKQNNGYLQNALKYILCNTFMLYNKTITLLQAYIKTIHNKCRQGEREKSSKNCVFIPATDLALQS